MNRGDDSSDLTEEILAHFGLRIAEQRKARGWTQRELGRRTSLAPTRLSRVERGGVWPKLEELIGLRQALGLSLDEMVLGEAAANPVEGLSGQERKRLRRLTIRARDLQGALRLFADELPPAPDEAEREIVRSRIECVVNDYLPLVIRSLEAALADAAPNAGDDLLPAGDGSL